MKKPDFDRVNDDLSDNIDRVGWAVISVFPTSADECWFAYTVGLAAKGLPEMIITGLPSEAAQPILNGLARRMLDGEKIPTDTPIARVLAGTYEPVLKAIPRREADEYMKAALNRHPDYRALQLFWPDASHRFPWHPEANPKFRQQQINLTGTH